MFGRGRKKIEPRRTRRARRSGCARFVVEVPRQSAGRPRAVRPTGMVRVAPVGPTRRPDARSAAGMPRRSGSSGYLADVFRRAPAGRWPSGLRCGYAGSTRAEAAMPRGPISHPCLLDLFGPCSSSCSSCASCFNLSLLNCGEAPSGLRRSFSFAVPPPLATRGGVPMRARCARWRRGRRGAVASRAHR